MVPNPRSQNKGSHVDDGAVEVWELIQNLVLGRVPASRVLELYYWSQEPGTLEILRAFLAMPSDGRAVVRAFFDLARPEALSVEIDQSGRMILSSPDVSDKGQILRHIGQSGAQQVG